jgi:MFS family permease
VATPLAAYRRVLTIPGAWVFSVSGLAARLPIAMVSLGIVLLVSTRTGSYGTAGAVAAAFLVGNASTGIFLGRLIDRLGQRRVLPVAATVFAVGLVGLMLVVAAHRPTPWPHVLAALAGSGLPPIGSSIRARWMYVVADKRDLHTAFAIESVLDEVVFIIGPALVTILAAGVHPMAGLVVAVVASVGGTAVLVTQGRTEPPATPHGRAEDRAAMPWGVLVPLTASAFAMGALLGGVEVSTVALAEQLGSSSLAGLMLAIWAVGSLVSGIITGARPPRADNATRFRWGLLALGLSMLPMPFVDGFLMFGVFLFVSGFAIAPTLIAACALLEQAVPSGRITEGSTIFTTGLGGGLAPGAALVGMVVDRSGATTSFWVPAAAGLLGAAVAVALPSMRQDGSRLRQPAGLADPSRPR